MPGFLAGHDYVAYWSEKFAIAGSRIEDEYGGIITPEQMLSRMQRGSPSKSPSRMSEKDLAINNAEYHDDGDVLRCKLLDGFCISNTAKYYDVIDTEFC